MTNDINVYNTPVSSKSDKPLGALSQYRHFKSHFQFIETVDKNVSILRTTIMTNDITRKHPCVSKSETSTRMYIDTCTI